ncbi:MAG: response regulator [Lewinellaceae bacterium]|jgi:two-component system OmpR family response regulator|nr:response regulator [Lewinellaceae bacterium]
MNTGKKSVFLVDDDNMFLTMLTDHLEALERYNVSTFTTGEACMEQLGKKPDVIVLDYYLDSAVPGALNGMEILQRIKSVDPELKVVMLSSQEHYGIALQTIAKGALYYVIKDNQAFGEIEHLLSEIV